MAIFASPQVKTMPVNDHGICPVSDHGVPQVAASGTAKRTSVREPARSPQDAVPHDRLRMPGWLLAGCLLPVALLLAWLLLARLDFLYPVWYQVLSIEEHITQYAPQNRHGREDFVETTPAEHRRLFGLIVASIQGKGKPLEEAVYHDAQGRELGKFLRAEEVGHLNDVKRLVGVLTTTGWGLTAAALVLSLGLWWWRLPLPPPAGVAVMWLALLGAAAIVLWWQGPLEVFDRLHEWVFPPDHPWFFYYQDSLMTTTMKAPQIFAAIAALWALVALVCYGLLYAGLGQILTAPTVAGQSPDEGGPAKPAEPATGRRQRKKKKGQSRRSRN